MKSRSVSSRWMLEPSDVINLRAKSPPLSRQSVHKYVKRYSVRKPKGSPRVSVVIVAYNEVTSLGKLLKSLDNQSARASFEVIIVDNGLPASSVRNLARDSSLSYIKLKDNYGPSLGRNVGSVFAHGDIVAFLDADGEVSNNYVDEVMSAMNDPHLIAVRGRVTAKKPNSFVPNFYDLGDNPDSMYVNLEGISAWRRGDFMKAGGFEQSLYGMEGAVLCYRMVEFYDIKRNQFGYAPNLHLVHNYDKGLDHFVAKTTRTTKVLHKLELFYPFITTFMASYDIAKAKSTVGGHLYDKHASQVKAEVKRLYSAYADELAKLKWAEQQPVAKPKFSVVIPYYNAAKTIRETINSVFWQSLRDVELIIVDDFSNDPHSIDALSKLPKSVKLFRNKRNVGCGESRNVGIKHARAQYILCLDADDTIEPGYLEKAYNVLNQYKGVGVVGAWTKMFGTKHGEWRPHDPVSLSDALIDSPVTGTSCFRKKAWSDAGGYKGRGHFEDWELWLGVIRAGWQIRVLQSFEFNYRISASQMSNETQKVADNLMMSLVQEFSEMYSKDYAQVIAKKHQKLFNERINNRRLSYENQKLKDELSAVRSQLGVRASLRNMWLHYRGIARKKVGSLKRRLRSEHGTLTVELHDQLFTHGHTAARGQLTVLPRSLRYDRSGAHEVTLFTDKNLDQAARLRRKHKLAWLVESPAYHKAYYDYIARSDVYSGFERVYTFDKRLLKLDSRFRFLPIGGSWVPDVEWRLYSKSKNVTIVASQKRQLEGHLLRHEVIKRYSSRIDRVQGRGYAPFESTTNALAPFRYAIVIENTRQDYYFTEKIIDCFATGTIPIYWGCPSIGNFFNEEGIIQFSDICQLPEILKTISKKDYARRQTAIADNFKRAKAYRMPEDRIYEDIRQMAKSDSGNLTSSLGVL